MSGGARASCGLVFAAIRLCLLLLLLLLLLPLLLVVVLLLPRAAAAAPLWRRRGRELLGACYTFTPHPLVYALPPRVTKVYSPNYCRFLCCTVTLELGR